MTSNSKKDTVYLSLIIPAYNEEKRIAKSLKQILQYLETQPYASEVVIVNDGSVDRTVEEVHGIYQGRDRVRILQNGKNLGKGGAVRLGILQARGEFLFFTDADLSVPIETIGLFLTNLEEGFDLAIGTREKKYGAIVEVHQPIYREFMGRVYTCLSNRILGLNISDFTCGFKGFRREVAKEIFSRLQLKNWSFDAEILYLAQLKGYRVMEVPVTWRDSRETKVRLWRDAIASFIGLFQIRLYNYWWKYR